MVLRIPGAFGPGGHVSSSQFALPFPELTVTNAREVAQAYKAQLAKGEDPEVKKKQLKAELLLRSVRRMEMRNMSIFDPCPTRKPCCSSMPGVISRRWISITLLR